MLVRKGGRRGSWRGGWSWLGRGGFEIILSRGEVVLREERMVERGKRGNRASWVELLASFFNASRFLPEERNIFFWGEKRSTYSDGGLTYKCPRSLYVDIMLTEVVPWISSKYACIDLMSACLFMIHMYNTHNVVMYHTVISRGLIFIYT